MLINTQRWERRAKLADTARLQKAVALTIAAGYQLDKEAFDFLNLLSAAEDPAKIMQMAVQKIIELDENPLFIGRNFLEQLLQKSELSNGAVAQPLEGELQVEKSPAAIQEAQTFRITEAKRPFHPYAKEIESKLNIIEDPSGKLNTEGTIDDYLTYFQDRFKRIEKLLRQRMDVKSASSVIDALKAQPSSRFKIIGMVTEKRESKGKTILNIEDLQASITVLIPQNASEDLQKKAHMLLLDQVVCLSVVKTRSNLLIGEDIILPDVPQRTPHKAAEPVYAVLTADMHVGSAKFQRDSFNRFVLWLNGKYGSEQTQEIASHVKYVVVAGDVVDGIGIYPNQVKELAIKDVEKQYRLAARFMEQIPDYIEVIVTPGNHDTPRKALPQPAISNNLLKTLQESHQFHSLGSPSIISLHGVEILVYHGRSLDDIISTVPGMSMTHPENAMKLLLQSRHLAPVYGGKTLLSAESRDHLVIERVPDIFHAGHIHALGYTSYRGVLVVNSGCWQDQTEYMRRNGFMPTPSKVPVVNLQTLEVTIVPFN